MPARRAFLIGMAIPASGLNPRATCYLSRCVTGQARTLDELATLSCAINAGMACGVLSGMAGLLCGFLLSMVGHDTLAAVVALGPFLSLHALWHYYMRR